MANIYKIIRVFVGSPGGLDPERRLISRVAEEINDTNSEHWECRIEIVGWEETLPGMARPQELINRDLDTCDYFIGIMWEHWGSPPDGGKYTSGFEEEFERARERIAARSMKDLFLYFKEIDAGRMKDPGPSLRRVLEFRQKCVAERRQLFKDYKEIDEFERHIRRALTKIGWREVQQPGDVKEAQTPRSTSESSGDLATVDPSSSKLLDDSCIKFLKSIIDKPSEWEKTTATEVARFRLISQGVERAGNDAQIIGTHDANLLYRYAPEFAYSALEKRTLLNSAIANFHNSSVPLWSWLFTKDPEVDPSRYLNIAALFGGTGTRQNAIEILRALGRPTPNIGGMMNEEKAIQFWMDLSNKPETASIFRTAMEFLSESGSISDMKSVEQYIPRLPDERRSDAVGAVVRIALRQSVASAIQKLLQYDPDSVEEQLIQAILKVGEIVSTKSLLECLNAKAGILRRAAADMLHNRGVMDSALALRLSTDPEIGVRYVALTRLRELGEPQSDEVVASSLTKYGQVRKGIMPLLGSSRDTSLYLKYKQAQTGELPFRDLKHKALGGDDPDDLAIQELFVRHHRKMRKEVRGFLKNDFADLVIRAGGKIDGVVEDGTFDPKLASRRRLWIKFATEAVARDASRSDIKLIRDVVDRHKIGFSLPVIGYFERFGSVLDASRVLRLREEFDFYTLTYPKSRRDEASILAAALVKMGRNQIIDVLESIVDIDTRTAFFGKLPRAVMGKLENSLFVKELKSDNTQHRQVVALKCCDALPKARLKRLLEAYWLQESYYYNVIHWLDAGLAMPRAEVRRLAHYQLLRLQMA